ncbi:DUF7144 family membrane protein [Streptacidiphilus neutrinimicus]|uniref:DUF7144 family membrane protein n=1 Tax=Streptacidiphilus neutrinimicus TaxID=105420 RepID=UPI0005A9F405|nr:hypothetical protein [Streptacidiphilus neutrinimicus]
MTTPTPTRGNGAHEGRLAAGAVVFAAVLLLVGGVLGVLEGASAVSKDKVYVATPHYVYQFSLTGWGWVHIVLGILAILAGVGLLADQTWARWAGIGIAGLSLIAQFLWLPYYPFWSVVMMAVDVFVIWGLTSHRRVSDF